MTEQEKNRVSVEIYGHTYKIVGPESAGHMKLVAKMVDEQMRDIGKHNKSLDTSKLAVLTAVNAVHEYLKLKEQIEQIEQIELLEDQVKKLKD